MDSRRESFGRSHRYDNRNFNHVTGFVWLFSVRTHQCGQESASERQFLSNYELLKNFCGRFSTLKRPNEESRRPIWTISKLGFEEFGFFHILLALLLRVDHQLRSPAVCRASHGNECLSKIQSLDVTWFVKNKAPSIPRVWRPPLQSRNFKINSETSATN